MIKLFTYLDEGCLRCKEAIANLKNVPNWEDHFEIVDICVDSSPEVKTPEQTAFSEQAIEYGIKHGPCIVMADEDVFPVPVYDQEISTEFFQSLI